VTSISPIPYVTRTALRSEQNRNQAGPGVVSGAKAGPDYLRYRYIEKTASRSASTQGFGEGLVVERR